MSLANGSAWETEMGISCAESESYFSGEGQPTTKTAIQRAKKDGLSVIYPGPKELQIDIDNEKSFTTFSEHLKILSKYLGIQKIVITPSLSGEPGHYHITVSCDRFFGVPERISLQALLGSDLRREVLGFIMMKNGEGKPTLFLEKK
jgi:hypothetical protein